MVAAPDRRAALRPYPPAFRALACLLAVVSLAPPSIARAGDGDPDGGFGTNGRAIHSWPPSTIQAEANAVATAADGSVVVAGWLSEPAPVQRDAISLVRFRADGSHDAAFGDAGVALFDLDPASPIGEQALGVFALAGGRTLVAARRTLDDSHQPLLLAVRADGTADPAFGANGVREIDTARWAGKRLQFFAALRDGAGRVLLAGAIVDGGIDALVARALPNGDIDASFGDAGWTRLRSDEGLIATALASDDRGRILVAGKTLGDTTDRPMIARLDPDGVPDVGFGDDGLVRAVTGLAGDWSATAVASAVRPVVGSLVQHRLFVAIGRSSPRAAGVLALSNDGTIANGFGDHGFVDLSLEEGTRLTALAVRRDRRLVVAGSIDPNGAGVGDFLVARMDFNGAFDTTFDGNGRARYRMNADGDTYDTPAAMALSGERPVVAGTLYNNNTPSHHVGVLRLQSDALFADEFE